MQRTPKFTSPDTFETKTGIVKLTVNGSLTALAKTGASQPTVSSHPDSEPASSETKQIDDSVMDSSRKGHSNIGNEEPLAILYGTARIANITGDSSGPKVTDGLDIADKLSAISMTEED